MLPGLWSRLGALTTQQSPWLSCWRLPRFARHDIVLVFDRFYLRMQLALISVPLIFNGGNHFDENIARTFAASTAGAATAC